MKRRILITALVWALLITAGALAQQDAPKLVHCEYSVFGGMENEDRAITLRLDDAQDTAVLTVADRDGFAAYGVPATALEALAALMAEYDPAGWASLPEREEYALDAPTRRLVLTYEDGTEAALDSDLESSGAALSRAEAFLEALAPKAELTVGEDVDLSAVTDFYYTVESSTAVSFYQRYRFYAEDGGHYFYHETRSGGSWPQTEADITASGTIALDDGQWQAFFDHLAGGTVRDREESLDDGDDGPWCFLYWEGDGGTCQEYSFPSPGAQLAFEAFCEELREAG